MRLIKAKLKNLMRIENPSIMNDQNASIQDLSNKLEQV